MSKEGVSIQFTRDTFVFNELLSIVSGDGMLTFQNWLEQVNHSLTNQVGGASFDFSQQGQTRLSFCQGYDGLAMPFASNSIHFPIADPLMLVDDCWPLFNTYPVWRFSSTALTAKALTTFPLAASSLAWIFYD